MYVGFAPFDEPQISLSIVLENAGGGGSQAAPIARKIMDYYFSEHPLEIAQTDVDEAVEQ